MADVNVFDDEQQRRPGLASAPQLASPRVFSGADRPTTIGDIYDYGNGTQAVKVDGGFKYDFRDTPYQDLLGDNELQFQRNATQARASGQTFNGQHAAEDDASLAYQMGVKLPNMSAVSAAQSGSGLGAASRDTYNIQSPGFQFNDPYTQQLEQVAQQQIAKLSQPQQNPALEQLLSFLGTRFKDLSETPGYSPDELAVLRTQALEPIEQDRTASNQRALQRAAAGGYLPTSGITQLTAAPNGGTETIDTSYDRMRAAVQRDLALKAIDQRNADLNQAMQVGQLAGITIPQGQRAEDQQRRSELVQLAQLLYNLPRQAMLDAQGVVNGTSGPNDVYTQALQIQQQQRAQQAQDAQKWAAIGQLISGMVF